MALPTSVPIKFSQIQAEFSGGTSNISNFASYATGSNDYVKFGTAVSVVGTPSSGTPIKFSQFVTTPASAAPESPRTKINSGSNVVGTYTRYGGGYFVIVNGTTTVKRTLTGASNSATSGTTGNGKSLVRVAYAGNNTWYGVEDSTSDGYVSKSTDGGATWANTSAAMPAAMQGKSTLDITCGDGAIVVYVRDNASYGDGCYSTDGGATWNSINFGGATNNMRCMIFNASDSNYKWRAWYSTQGTVETYANTNTLGSAWTRNFGSIPSSITDARNSWAVRASDGFAMVVGPGVSDFYASQVYYKSGSATSWSKFDTSTLGFSSTSGYTPWNVVECQGYFYILPKTTTFIGTAYAYSSDGVNWTTVTSPGWTSGVGTICPHGAPGRIFVLGPSLSHYK